MSDVNNCSGAQHDFLKSQKASFCGRKKMRYPRKAALALTLSFALLSCSHKSTMVYHLPGEEWEFGWLVDNNKCGFEMDNDLVTFTFVFSEEAMSERITIDGVTITDVLINGGVEDYVYCYTGTASIYHLFKESHNTVSFRIVDYDDELEYWVSVDEAPLYGQPVRIAILFETKPYEKKT